MKQTYTSCIQLSVRHLLMAVACIGGLSLSAAQVRAEEPAPAKDSEPSIVAPAISLAAKDWDALRTWFHQPQFNITDGLSNYSGDYRSEAANTKDLAAR